MEDSVKGIKSQILYDWRNHFETRAQLELFITQINMLIESVEKECRLTQLAADGLTVCQNCGSWLRAGECENCNSPFAPAAKA